MQANKKCLPPFQDYVGHLCMLNGRVYVRLRHKVTGKAKLMMLSRYRMSVKLRRVLLRSEEVDHIDDDSTNDDINNLQLLSRYENTLKHLRRRYGPTLLKSKAKPSRMLVVTDADIERIRMLHEQGNSSYKISKITGFARNTVMRYW